MKTCEFCLLARIDPDLRERIMLPRITEGNEFLIVGDVRECQMIKHSFVMEDMIKAFRKWEEQ